MSEENKYDKACGGLFRKTIAAYWQSKGDFGEFSQNISACSSGIFHDPKTGKPVNYKLIISDREQPHDHG